MCFSSGSFYIFEPIESALAQVSATGKCELATSGQSPSGAPFFVPELPISIGSAL